jgi:DNA-binding transcriptional regulator YiaG
VVALEEMTRKDPREPHEQAVGLRCACGGALREVTLRDFDFTTLAGVAAVLVEAPGLRCDACRGETLEGEVVNDVLAELTLRVVLTPGRLPADHARFLRRRMGLTQAALADRVGCAPESVARWEAGGASPRVDLRVRLAALAHLLRGLWRSAVAEHPGTG